MTRFLLSGLAACILAACNSSEKTSLNKFSDPVIVSIADLQDRRSTDSLHSFFSHENAAYRKEAVLAFASIQDSASVDKLATVLLADQDTAVRRAAVFALGQTRSSRSGNALKDAAAKEKDAKVLEEIVEAYGKVTKQWISPVTTDVKAGIAWSLYRAGLNNATGASANATAAALLNKNESERTRLGAAHFFARGAKNFDDLLGVIGSTATTDPSADVRMAAAAALRKIVSDSSLMVIEKILANEQDYRVRVNAIQAMRAFPFAKTKDHLLKALNEKNANAGIAASEVIKASITDEFWIELANRVSDLKNWRIQANLYEAIVKVKENKSVIDEIKSTYQRSRNPYQKAALLTALQQSMTSLDFIEQELLKADTPVVRSSAAAAIVELNRNKKFQSSMKQRFAGLYTKAMQTGDAAVIGTVAGALGDSTLGYRDVVKDHSFLKEARQKLSLPKDNEALQPLEAAIAYFERTKAPAVTNDFNHPIDWALVKSISKDQRAIIHTSKGTITLRLLVEEAPGSVANFVALARRHYFDKKLFHRVVSNFVIQAGCNRGDGWGSEDYSIRSEFSQRRYTTGSVGMASAGKDTEGTQWFITHSPTPHLDGRYTIFAEVESGMEVVHHIGVGDEILSVEIETTDVAKAK